MLTGMLTKNNEINIRRKNIRFWVLRHCETIPKKGKRHNQGLLLREDDQIMRDERKVAEVMNKYFVNINELHDKTSIGIDNIPS